MKMLKINENVPEASAIGLGCMRITGLGSAKAVQELVEASMEAGVNLFVCLYVCLCTTGPLSGT